MVVLDRNRQRQRRVYISGPISGHDRNERKRVFAEASATLRKQGFVVINPFLVPKPDASWGECLRADICELVTAGRIFMLSGWEHSKGARLEHNIAKRLGMTVEYQERSNKSLVAGGERPRRLSGSGS